MISIPTAARLPYQAASEREKVETHDDPFQRPPPIHLDNLDKNI
jgi:hypothetical protein